MPESFARQFTDQLAKLNPDLDAESPGILTAFERDLADSGHDFSSVSVLQPRGTRDSDTPAPDYPAGDGHDPDASE